MGNVILQIADSMWPGQEALAIQNISISGAEILLDLPVMLVRGEALVIRRGDTGVEVSVEKTPQPFAYYDDEADHFYFAGEITEEHRARCTPLYTA